MPTVQGAGSVHPTITAGTDYSVAQQASAVIQSAANIQLATMTSGGTAPTVPSGQYGGLIVDASQPSFPGGGIGASGYRFFVVGDTYNPITVSGGGAIGQQVILGQALGPSGIVSYNAGGGSGTVVGGDGKKVITTGPGTNFAVYTGTGNDTINLSSSPAAGQDTVSAGTGQNLVNLGSAPTQVQSTGADTINVSLGSTTVQAIGSAAAVVLQGNGSGARTFINGGNGATVSGGTGSATVFGAAGGGNYQGGSGGNNLLLGGSGQAYLTGSGSGDVLIATSTSNLQVLLAGAGNETLLGSLSTMNNIFAVGSGSALIVAGSGNDTIVGGLGSATVTGGAGADAFTFNALGNHGGSMTITDFTPGIDHVKLLNYADAPASLAANAQLVAPAATRVTLSDGSSITFLGLSSVNQNFFG